MNLRPETTNTRATSARRWTAALGALVLGSIAGAWWLAAAVPEAAPAAGASEAMSPKAAPALLADPAAVIALLPGVPGPASAQSPPNVAAGSARVALPASPQAQAAAQRFRQLSTLPPGAAAIDLAEQIEAGLEPANAMAYMDALFNGEGPEVERAAIKALARAGDASVMQALAAAYGRLAPELRGRVLQVLETASNPVAVDGLLAIVAEDVGERRSPLVASAMVGMAHIGTQASIEQLMAQAAGPNDAYALNALQRLNTRQGVEMLRTAAAGGKGYETLSPNLRATFGRVAAVAEATLPN